MCQYRFFCKNRILSCGLRTEECMETTLNSHFRSLMWYNSGNLLLLCHNKNTLYMLALCLMISHHAHANIANTSVIKNKLLKLCQLYTLCSNTCIPEDFFKCLIRCPVSITCKISLTIKDSFLATNATSSTFWWLEIISKVLRLKVENYLRLFSYDKRVIHKEFYQVAKVL